MSRSRKSETTPTDLTDPTDGTADDTTDPPDGADGDGGEQDAPAVPAAAASVSADDVMPETHGRRDAAALNLLFDACERFNINPSATVRPRELAAWRFSPADVLEQRPAAVTLVTAGGVKLKFYAGDVEQDPDTEERLRAIFRAWKVDPVTKQDVPVALPRDLSLPAEAVLGTSTSGAHRHPKGYLRRPR